MKGHSNTLFALLGVITLGGCASSVTMHDQATLSTDRRADEISLPPAVSKPRPDKIMPVRAYTHPVYHWSITYPAEWRMDSANPDFVRFLASGGLGLCGIHSNVVRFNTLGGFTEFMEASYVDSFKARGVKVRTSARQEILLPQNVVGTDIVHDILSGGRDRIVYVLADGVGYGIDCETYAKDWKALEPSFDLIVNSFTLEPHSLDHDQSGTNLWER